MRVHLDFSTAIYTVKLTILREKMNQCHICIHALFILLLLLLCTVLCREGDARLQGSVNGNKGRVEICRLEQWQTVCNMEFDSMEASVVCAELGFSRMSK